MRDFSVRNVYYLRISALTILTMVLYLDQRHVEWMNENPGILDYVVHSVVRPRLPDLFREASSGDSKKMEVVDLGVCL